ncbi:MAG: hypothetical protein OXC08_17415 [Thiotrichales bacterium]|nr:hypothetical protein [Thiotrichales bacterium]
MPVPDYQSLILPTLKALSDGVETSISELGDRNLSPESDESREESFESDVRANG